MKVNKLIIFVWILLVSQIFLFGLNIFIICNGQLLNGIIGLISNSLFFVANIFNLIQLNRLKKYEQQEKL